MDHELKVGDVVKLRSGGPLMTIEYIGSFSMSGGEEDKAKCVWFEGTKRKDGVFELPTLSKEVGTRLSGTISRA
jgi:uncharacterized protein YodC (DUF2158 family)